MQISLKPHQIAKAVTSIGFSVLMLFSVLPVQANDIYLSTGANGEPRYTQMPPRNVSKYEVITLRNDGRREDKGEMAGKTNGEQPKQLSATEQQMKMLEERMKKQEQQDLVRKCQQLRNNLTNLNINGGGKIYEMDQDGNKKYLDDNQIEEKRGKIQQAINQFCSGQGQAT